MTAKQYFTPRTFGFLRDLAANNNRSWFQENKPRYEDSVRDPALRFVEDFAPRLEKISKHFRADPRPVGGSLFRIYRDTRFSRDKSPYKTHTGIQFRHEKSKDAYCPGFYLHIQPKQVFVGVGIWHPDGATLKAIRESLIENPAQWKRSAHGKKFQSRFDLAGDALKRPPRGIDPDHPLIEDLKRKDFIGVCRLLQGTVTSPGFIDEFDNLCKAGSPLVALLCKATKVPF